MHANFLAHVTYNKLHVLKNLSLQPAGLLHLPIHNVVGLGGPGPCYLVEYDEAISLNYLLLLDVVLSQQREAIRHLFLLGI